MLKPKPELRLRLRLRLNHPLPLPLHLPLHQHRNWHQQSQHQQSQKEGQQQRGQVLSIDHDAYIDPSSLKQSLENVRDANRAALIRKVVSWGPSTRLRLPKPKADGQREQRGPGEREDGAKEYRACSHVQLPSPCYAQHGLSRGAQPLKKEWQIDGNRQISPLNQPWLQFLSDTRPWPDTTGIEALSAEIEAFAGYMEPSQAEKAAADHTVAALKHTVESAVPEFALELIGSRASGLAMPLSDVDLNLLDRKARLDDIMDRPRALKTLRKLERRLRQVEQLDNLALVKRARIPIIRGTFRPSNLDFQIQQTTNAFNSTHHVRAYLKHYPTLRSLFFVLRHVLLMRGLSDGSKHGLASYPLFNAILASIKLDEQHFRPCDAGSQLLSFLQLYSDIDFDTTGISVDPAALLPLFGATPDVDADVADVRPAFPHAMYLRDPADPSNDLGRNCVLIRQVQVQFASMKQELESRLERWKPEVSQGGQCPPPSPSPSPCPPRGNSFPLLQALVGDYKIFELERACLRRMGLGLAKTRAGDDPA